MDAIVEISTGARIPVRFVLLSPIRHEDLRATRPGLPDAAEHNKLLEQYAAKVAETAEERKSVLVNLFAFEPGNVPAAEASYTTDGIHLNANNGSAVLLPSHDCEALGWAEPQRIRIDGTRGNLNRITAYEEPLRAAILRKNDLFFHRFRPGERDLPLRLPQTGAGAECEGDE
jgi:hypothetical protein